MYIVIGGDIWGIVCIYSLIAWCICVYILSRHRTGAVPITSHHRITQMDIFSHVGLADDTSGGRVWLNEVEGDGVDISI